VTGLVSGRDLRLLAAACATAWALGTGCARLVTVEPENVASLNDSTWKVQTPPTKAPLAAAGGAGAETPATAEIVAVPAPPSAAGPGAGEAEAHPPATAESPRPAAVAADAPVAAPLPFRLRPAVQQALHSPLDALGIPTSLYAVDPLLSAHRREMASQASARQAVGTGSIVFGVLTAGFSAWAISFGLSNVNSSNSRVSNSASQVLVYGSALAALSIGEIIGGIAVAASDSDPGSLQRYFRETYADPR
jgi:hypothetical protein